MVDPSPRPAPWRYRRLPSVLVFVVVLALIGLATAAVARDAAEVLPQVGKDQLGDDAWTEPLGIEAAGDLAVGRLPDCAAGSVTRIALWDPNSEPYWEVTGPPTQMTAFYIGVTPPGFTVVAPYRKPPRGTVLRLVAFRQEGDVAGIRYLAADLREERVVSGSPLSRYTVEGFQTARICSDSAVTATTLGDGETPLTVPG